MSWSRIDEQSGWEVAFWRKARAGNMRVLQTQTTEAVRCEANASLTDCVPLGQPNCGLGRREYPTCQNLRQWLSATDRSRCRVWERHMRSTICEDAEINRSFPLFGSVSLYGMTVTQFWIRWKNDSTARACLGLSLRRHGPSHLALAPPGIGDTFRPVCFCLTVANWNKQKWVNVGSFVVRSWSINFVDESRA